MSNIMIEQMPKYESYKDSGVEWLGELPTHWETKQLKYIVKIHSGNGFPVELQGLEGGVYPFLKVSDISGNEIYQSGSSNRVEEASVKRYKWNKVPVDSIVAAKIGEALRKNHRKILKEESIIDNNCIAFEPLYLDSKYNYYLHTVIDFEWFVNPGAVPSISVSKYKELKVSLPPQGEQVAIAKFLDKKTSQIDEAIAIKQKQIELLKERKQIIIQQAVTQGLNPDVPMKDSGVDWIGEIPEHWTVSKIGHYARVYNGSTPSRDVKRYWDEGTIPWMSSGKVNDYIISTPSELITTAALRECSLRIFPKGTVLIGIVGQGKTRGTSAMLAIDAVINQNVAGIIPSEKILSEFLHQYLIQAYDEVRNQGQGSNQEALNCQILSSFKIAFPSVSEQKEIVHFIAKQSQKLDQSIDIQFNQIEKLKEYKATLINSAVTGKIKVTELV